MLQKNLDIVEKEALAIYWGIMRLRSFLLGRTFVVRCDHKPLQYIFNNERCSPKVLRWKLQLQEFDFRVTYCKGSDNVVADCFSRINGLDENPLPIVGENEVRRAQEFDPETIAMVQVLSRRTTTRPLEVSPVLWGNRGNLKTAGGKLFHIDGRIFVPHRMRLKLLTVAHGCHPGEKATAECLKNTSFGPKCQLKWLSLLRNVVLAVLLNLNSSIQN